MSRRLLGLIILCILMSFSTPLFASAFDLPRHVDPAELEEENPFPSKLFLLYRFLFDSITLEDFAGAKDRLASLVDVYAPSETKFVLNRFNELLFGEVDDLNLTRVNIDETIELLRWLQEEKAEPYLAQALLHIALANTTLGELEGAAVQLSSYLHTPSIPLVEGLDDVTRLLEEYLATVRELQAEATLIALTPPRDTVLTIWADEDEPLVGFQVNVGGRLEDLDGQLLSHRVVDLLIDGSLVVEAITGDYGDFEVGVEIPYVYKDSVKLWAEFWPVGDDLDVYAPSRSNLIELNLIYYGPVLEVEGPSWAYPGAKLSIAGRLTYGGEPLQGFDVLFKGLRKELRIITGADGAFLVDLDVPSDYPGGLTTIGVTSSPRGEYGPAEAEFVVEVVKLDSKLWVGGPSWIVSGNELRVEGIVTVGFDPLPGCRVVTKDGGASVTAVCNKDGFFQAYLSLPFVMFTGRYPYTVTAYPAEAWIEPVSVNRSVLVVNVYTLIGGPSFAFIALVYTVNRISSRPSRRRKEEEVSGVEEPFVSVEVRDKREEIDSFPAIYWKALRMVSDYSGLGLQSSQTIREYLGVVEGGLDKPSLGVFRNLSMLYERWFYGVRLEPDLGEALRLLEELGELLSVEG